MSDYLAAQITIGGCISRAIAPRLCKLIGAANLLLDWEEPFEPRTAEDLLAGRREIDGEWVLQLTYLDAPYGAFPELEAFLVAHEIPFDRQSDPGHGYDGALVIFRPGAGPSQFIATSNGEPAVRLQPVWDLEASLRDYARHVGRAPRRDLQAMLRRILEQIEDTLPARPAALPSFEVGKSVGLRKAA
jgi:hypothetical protein